MSQHIVLGIDGGGTYTRVAAADVKGKILAFSKYPGSHPGKNQHPDENVKAAIREVLHQANTKVSSVECIVGGFAGLNRPEDRKWANEFLNILGLECVKVVLNDAHVAQFGAFVGGQGILAIAGTGSIVLGKTDAGSIIRNYDFHHDSAAAARYLSYSVIYEIITQKHPVEEQGFIQSVLSYWGTSDIEEFRILASKGFSENRVKAIQQLSGMAAFVTSAASKGSKIAYRACEKVIDSLVIGINLVASRFPSIEVPLALIGGVIKDPFMTKLLMDKLDRIKSNHTFSFQAPQLSPVLGAVLYSYSELGIPVNQEIVDKLKMAEHTNNFQ
ncbi:BadF/BadG/BcrA/BcrD ATPase family protein [Neobacillus pocheonensis]|uniref:BadF/BadG/BcrA/BcrD ATPase family protein n=1 Tax=Neobacillus pocheonensis TaxID=363869 RepID=UPI003D29B52F